MAGSLWGAEFEVPSTPKVVKKVLEKIKTPKEVKENKTKVLKSNKVSVADKLVIIREDVNRVLGKYGDATQLINTPEALHSYITEAIKQGVIAIDTETNNSLDPVSCKLMGACIYTPTLKNVYIPVNHVDMSTGEKLPNQLTEEEIREEFDRLTVAGTKVITHNGKFDYEVLKMTTGYVMQVYWDTLVGEKLLDENKHEYGLKYLYREKFDSEQEKYDIEHLFQGIEYAYVEPELFALYAATDAYMTYLIYTWQLERFDLPDNARIKKLMLEVEMPVLTVAAEMELTGVCLDAEYGKRLSAKYAKELEKIDAVTMKELEKYNGIISEWRMSTDANEHPVKAGKLSKSKAEQLQDPVNLDSPTQLAIFLYDVLKCEPVDKKKPRGTGEEQLQAIYSKYKIELCNIILERRGLLKLISTYVDKLPNCVNPVDNRLHAKFNQLGAQTGRFSSSDPNLQNIPSKNKEIRMLFRASEGYALVGADYSQQEPRLLCSMAHDEAMLGAYKAKKDLYATIAQNVYHNKYEDNLEHHLDGSPNPEGKKRRSNCKSILLGIMYGRGVASIAEQTGCSVPEAQKIIDDFYKGFPSVKKWTDKTQTDAKKLGYVEDFMGRRRRLPDLLKPKYSIIVKGEDSSISPNFNPLLECKGIIKNEHPSKAQKWQSRLDKVRGRNDYQKIKSEAEAEGVTIIDNGAFIAQAERQCVNARIQGGASTITKIAMTRVYNDPELKRLGFRLLLCVHDELIGECPEENSKDCGQRLSEVMIDSVKGIVECPMKCDETVTHRWYEDEVAAKLQEFRAKKLSNGCSEEEVLKEIENEHIELTTEEIEGLLVMEL